MNLFELNDNYKTLASRDDLDPTILKDTLESIKDDRKTKLDNLASWADQLKSEIDFMTDKKKSWEEEITYRKNKLTWIKKYITDVLDDAGIKMKITCLVPGTLKPQPLLIVIRSFRISSKLLKLLLNRIRKQSIKHLKLGKKYQEHT